MLMILQNASQQEPPSRGVSSLSRVGVALRIKLLDSDLFHISLFPLSHSPLSLSLSLTLKHTQTHTHTHTLCRDLYETHDCSFSLYLCFFLSFSFSFSSAAIRVNYESIMHAINILINTGLASSREKKNNKALLVLLPKNTQLVEISIIWTKRK